MLAGSRPPATLTTFATVCLFASLISAARGQVKLESKFPEGKVLKYRSNFTARQVLNLGGMEIPSVVRQTKVYSRTIGSRRPDGKLAVDEKVESLRVEHTLPGRPRLSFDSSKPDRKNDDGDLAFLGEVFKLESEIAYSIVLDKLNKVTAIEGADRLKNKAEKLADSIAREEFQSEISADKLKQAFEQSLRRFPDNSVRPGETWERAEILDVSGKSFRVRRKYEYLATTPQGAKTLDKIRVTTLEVKLEPDPNSKLPLKIAKSDLKVDSSDGTILFDREAGDAVSVRDKVRFKGDMTFAGGGTEQTGAFDLTVDSTVELQPAKR
jgi:Family of unknown function (DUF6263)